jgi:hypothetical protein
LGGLRRRARVSLPQCSSRAARTDDPSRASRHHRRGTLWFDENSGFAISTPPRERAPDRPHPRLGAPNVGCSVCATQIAQTCRGMRSLCCLTVSPCIELIRPSSPPQCGPRPAFNANAQDALHRSIADNLPTRDGVLPHNVGEHGAPSMARGASDALVSFPDGPSSTLARRHCSDERRSRLSRGSRDCQAAWSCQCNASTPACLKELLSEGLPKPPAETGEACAWDEPPGERLEPSLK